MHRWLISSAMCAVIFLAGPATPSPGRAQALATITIQNHAYSPATVTISPGDQVVWLNADMDDHTATSDTGVWDTGVIPGMQDVGGVPLTSGSDFVEFDTPGTYPYHCSIHPDMHGTIIVEAANPTPSPVPSATATSTPSPTSLPTATATAIPTALPLSTATSMPTATSTALPTPTSVPVRLKISVSSALHANMASSLKVRVRRSDDGSPVSAARVKLNGRAVGISRILHRRTNAKGVAAFSGVRPTRAGRVTITASKSGFLTGKAKVRVH